MAEKLSAVKVALIQQHATPDRAENVQRGEQALRQAAADGAQIIGFAELALEPFYPQRPAEPGFEDLAETIPGPLTERFCRLARELEVVVALNLFEKHVLPDGSVQTFDSSPVIDADGSLLGITRMVHITEYDCFHEQGYYVPGDQGAPVYQTRFGKLGIAICYDRHFPEYMRALAVGGADLVLVPQAGSVGEWPEGLYEAEMRVAAFQNGYFVGLCNRVGQEPKLDFAGESFICDPSGNVVARAGQGTDEILHATLTLSDVERSHARQLFLRHRRPELYSEWLS